MICQYIEFYRHKNNNDDADDRPTDQVSNRERHVPPNREKKIPNNSRGEIPETFHCPSNERNGDWVGERWPTG